jgi:hypothetical protein
VRARLRACALACVRVGVRAGACVIAFVVVCHYVTNHFAKNHIFFILCFGYSHKNGNIDLWSDAKYLIIRYRMFLWNYNDRFHELSQDHFHYL